MLEYKINVLEKLGEVGFNSMTARQTGIFAQSTMKKFKDGDTNISLEILNRLCCILNMQPEDILIYKETETDREKVITKIRDFS